MRQRPLWRSLADAIVLIAAIAMVVSAMRVTGILTSETGNARAIDGDSLRIGKTEFRLHGIDAPEYRQTCLDQNGDEWPCGREALRALVEMVRNRETRCQTIDSDRYGRMVANCSVQSLSINEEMVRQGYAVAYIRHSSRHAALEREAQAAHRGIWRGTFENPEDFRARQRLMRGDVAGEITPDD